MYNRLILFFLLMTSLQSYSQKLLKDIASSDESSNINQSFNDFENYLIKGDTLFFLAQDTTFEDFHFKNIWFTTGTAVNTKKVTNGYQISETESYVMLTSFKGKAYFKNVLNSSLCATDGNTITVVKTFSSSTIQKASVIDGWLYVFVSNTATNTLELWKTDGTEVNTNKVADVYNGSHTFNSNFLFNSGDKIYFNLNISATGYETWITDGTAVGTKLLKDILPGPATGNPREFVKVGNTIFFNANDSNFNTKLWKTDGTEAGTTLVANTIEGNSSYFLAAKIDYNNQLYFSSSNSLYRTDGNTITLVKPGFSIYGNIVKMNNLMYFVRQNGSEFELWKSDGTADGTEKVKTVFNFPEYYYLNVKILAGASKIYFQLSIDRNNAFENITQHWVSDGTTAGTVNINTLNSNFSTGSINNQLAVVGDNYYFIAYDATNGFELWKSNGTSVGTLMVKNINKAIASSAPLQFTALGNDIFFSADDIKYGREIWKTDGTAANTQLLMDWNAHTLSDINYSAKISGMIAYNDIIIAQITNQLVKFSSTMPPTPYFSTSSLTHKNPEFIRYANKIYYKGWDPANGGYDLFVTDGNTASRVKDFTTSFVGGEPGNFIIWGGLLYFTTDNNSKIWKSDGTEAGTILVKTFLDGVVLSKFYEVNGLLLFIGYTSNYGDELWKTDGTEVGTTLVKDINPHGWSLIKNIVVYNGYLYFIANNGSTYNLYKSDGSSANTQVFGNIVSSTTPVVFKDKLLFIAYDTPSSAYWLWSTDGNSAHVKIQKLAETIQNSDAIVIKNINNNLLVFDILPTTARHELWASDGTTAGTQLAKVISQNALNNSYMNITEYVYNNNKLYFAADDGIHGKELWIWDFECPEFMIITSAVSQDSVFKVDKSIVGSNKINAGVKASYGANKYIALNPGFETKANTVFTAAMNGCINVNAVSNGTTYGPIFQHYPSKESFKPTIIQFLTDPVNIELLTVYESEKKNHNEQNIAWIIDESPERYILKMQVGEQKWTGYLPK